MNMSTQFLNQIGLKPNQVKRKQLTFMKKSAMALPRSLPRLLPIVASCFAGGMLHPACL